MLLIVFTTGDNLVQTGLVTNLGRPGGNVTGVHVLFTELESKKLGLLRDVVPQADVVAALVNQTRRSPVARRQNCRRPHKNLVNGFKSSMPQPSRT